MLFVIFQVGNAGYALEARLVARVIPHVKLRACPSAPACLAGLANYHGAAVPVIDFSLLMGGAPSVAWLSTRIILANYAGHDARQRMIGILAERVTSAMELAETDFEQAGVAQAGMAGLGGLAARGTGFVQRVFMTRLVPAELEQLLFIEPERLVS